MALVMSPTGAELPDKSTTRFTPSSTHLGQDPRHVLVAADQEDCPYPDEGA
jgi:hypothetical protein